MNIADKCVVSIHYTLKNGKGEEMDSSGDGAPLKYLHGARNIVPGLEAALDGKAPGDSLEVVVKPDDAYGEVDPALIQSVPRAAFEGVEDIRPGMQFQAQGPQGEVQLITVEQVEGEQVTVNGNHPLAGEELHFDVTVEDVREATDEEVEHGHVH